MRGVFAGAWFFGVVFVLPFVAVLLLLLGLGAKQWRARALTGAAVCVGLVLVNVLLVVASGGFE